MSSVRHVYHQSCGTASRVEKSEEFNPVAAAAARGANAAQDRKILQASARFCTSPCLQLFCGTFTDSGIRAEAQVSRKVFQTISAKGLVPGALERKRPAEYIERSSVTAGPAIATSETEAGKRILKPTSVKFGRQRQQFRDLAVHRRPKHISGAGTAGSTQGSNRDLLRFLNVGQYF